MQRSNSDIANKYKSKRFQKVRRLYFIKVKGLCERCYRNNIINSAKILHHKEYITEHNYMNDDIFFSEWNFEALCQDCHNKEHHRECSDYEFNQNGEIIKLTKC